MKAILALTFVLLFGLAFAATDLEGLDNENYSQFFNDSMDASYDALEDFPEFEGLVPCPSDLGEGLCPDEAIDYWIEVELSNINNSAQAGDHDDVIARSNELVEEVSSISHELGLSSTILSQFNSGLTDVSSGLSYLLTGVVPDGISPERKAACENSVISFPVLNGVVNVAPAGATEMASQECTDYAVSSLTGDVIDGFGTDFTFEGLSGNYPASFAGNFYNNETIQLEMQNFMGVPSLENTVHFYVFSTEGQIDYRPLAVPAMAVDGTTTISVEAPQDIETVFLAFCDTCEPFTGIVGTARNPPYVIVVTPTPRSDPVPPVGKEPLPGERFCKECIFEKTNGLINVFDKETGRLMFALKNDGELAFKLVETQEKLTFSMVQGRGQGVVFAEILDSASLNQYKVDSFNNYTYSTEPGYGGIAYAFGQFLNSGDGANFTIGFDAEEVGRTGITGPETVGDPGDGQQQCGNPGYPDCPPGQRCIDNLCVLTAEPADLPPR
jgi:hypothetical protein